ncbi:MAG TPA: hypothetical protein VNE62_01000 [Actinomycetota bacterium]|nr:hypothetical protein [Actinomycetota bacterium]
MVGLVTVAALLGLRPEDGPQRPRPTPQPAIPATAREPLGVLEGTTDAVRDIQTSELSALLTDLYQRAFLPPLPPPAATAAKRTGPPPTPVPRPDPAELVTQEAQPAFASGRTAFASGDATVRDGRVSFAGMVLTEQDRGVTALLEVEFTGTGSVPVAGTAVRPLRLRQAGQLYCIRTDQGWRLGGFDVQLTAEREVPPPSAKAPAPRAVALARWMP